MALQPTRYDYSGTHWSWLASAHGTQATRTVTLDADAFTADERFDDVVPAGVALRWTDEGAGKVGPYRPEGSDTAIGYLFTPRNVGHGDEPGAVLTRGAVKVANLPDGSGYEADVEADLPLIEHR